MLATVPDPAVPLCIDLDGTLVACDTLAESVLHMLKRKPWTIAMLPVWLLRGRAHLKARVAAQGGVDAESLPYRSSMLGLIREQERTRPIVLVTAAHARIAQQVSEHLALFTHVMATDGVNLKGERKARALVEAYGEKGFDYAGNDAPDLHVWRHAREAVVVAATPDVARRAREIGNVTREFDAPPSTFSLARTWVRAIRLHQWAKNALLFLPLLGAHRFLEWPLLADVLLGFVAFGCCASSIYIVNDLMDLASDRRHPRKRLRPFAAGTLSPLAGLAVSGLLLAFAIGIAITLRPGFLAWIGTYVAITLAYTFWLKRKVLIDVMTLAGLYTLRVIAGIAVAGLSWSFWLLAFSLFLFLSLAFVKRCSELMTMGGADSVLHGRGYARSDLPLLQSLGIASGFASVLVMALYVNSESVAMLYRSPEIMWLTVPVLLYWVSRVWLKTHRGEMHDDPVLFALRDRVSLGCGALFALVLVAATLAPW